MLIAALLLTLVGVVRRKLRGGTGTEATGGSALGVRLERVGDAVRRGATRLVREPAPALSVAVAVLGLAVVGTHLACSGQV
ncbi:hypothetical protein [Nocardia salmonicida]|uniref:hypothetical protein n=1 Tax=Nocardia salmonicida TaxID=53431 RepID=UPI0007A40D4F|nr:hypothetical protein [Nocardia salmonicida]